MPGDIFSRHLVVSSATSTKRMTIRRAAYASACHIVRLFYATWSLHSWDRGISMKNLLTSGRIYFKGKISICDDFSLQDLEQIGIETRGHRQRLLREIKKIPRVEIEEGIPVSSLKHLK